MGNRHNPAVLPKEATPRQVAIACAIMDPDDAAPLDYTAAEADVVIEMMHSGVIVLDDQRIHAESARIAQSHNLSAVEIQIAADIAYGADVSRYNPVLVQSALCKASSGQITIPAAEYAAAIVREPELETRQRVRDGPAVECVKQLSDEQGDESGPHCRRRLGLRRPDTKRFRDSSKLADYYAKHPHTVINVPSEDSDDSPSQDGGWCTMQ